MGILWKPLIRLALRRYFSGQVSLRTAAGSPDRTRSYAGNRPRSKSDYRSQAAFLQAFRSFSSKRPRWSNSACRDPGRRRSSDAGVHRLAIDAEHGVDSTEGERIRPGEPQGYVDSGAAPLTKCRRCDLGRQQRGQRINIGRYDLRQSTAERFSSTVIRAR